MYRVAKTFRFEAAHFLPDHDGKCKTMHGHSYRVEVVCQGVDVHLDGAKRGMVVDFGDIKKVVQPIVDALDHTVLNENPRLKAYVHPPTAETLAAFFYNEIRHSSLHVAIVRVWETDDCYAEYSA